MKNLFLIINREFINKVRNKSFIVMTILGPLLILGMTALIAFLTKINDSDIKKIAIHDANQYVISEFKNNKHTEYIDLSALPIDEAKAQASESYKALIYVPQADSIQQIAKTVQYISEDSPSLDAIFSIERKINDVITRNNIEKLNIDYKKIDEAKADSEITVVKFSGENTLKGINEIKIAIGSLFGYLIMMFIIIYGNYVMRSVIEEKTNRIIEIIISSVKPFDLMMGKIIGNSLAGILQFAIWAICGLAILLAAHSFMGSSPQVAQAQEMANAIQHGQSGLDNINLYIDEVMKLPIATLLISFVVFFTGGYFLYSSLYAAIGAAVDNETDSQQFLMPIIMPLMLGVYVGFFTVMNDPHGTVATIFSFIPFTSPIVMLMRIPFGVPLWQIITSMILLIATFFAVVWFASKIYRVGILMYGKKPSWKEIYKWLKY
ncbi:ABC transporter permease [Flavobacterium agricola]|uniref:ABC transporter permease n=1 Tax=Flavobacterium agricola TaxID=2870839 RepID=A0ABY6LVU2_9FLAO|nr:ABC transporter permease [Flavobacterium agricola]UYW00299.1 ABC transporter permease [Flavobacterium agricola]